jgi:hypothetical protein
MAKNAGKKGGGGLGRTGRNNGLALGGKPKKPTGKTGTTKGTGKETGKRKRTGKR